MESERKLMTTTTTRRGQGVGNKHRKKNKAVEVV